MVAVFEVSSDDLHRTNCITSLPRPTEARVILAEGMQRAPLVSQRGTSPGMRSARSPNPAGSSWPGCCPLGLVATTTPTMGFGQNTYGEPVTGNKPALHHYHQTDPRTLGMEPLEVSPA